MINRDLILKSGKEAATKQTPESVLINTLYEGSTFQQIDYASFSIDDVVNLATAFYDELDYIEDFDEYIFSDQNPLYFLEHTIEVFKNAHNFTAPILKKRKRIFI